jgi:hypothetical protein
MRDFVTRWWEFFSDADVKWTFGVMMFLCWAITLAWALLSFAAANPSTPTSNDEWFQYHRTIDTKPGM